MRNDLRHGKHLIPLVLVFLAALGAFLALRRAVVPEGFGVYGHYRAPAVDEVAARTPVFAGQQACADCHSPAVEARQAGKHRGVACEACHGPLAKHADDPSLKPKLPDSATLCARCHEADPAKPKAFPQVRTLEHSAGQACVTCHKAHHPAI